MKSLKNIIVIVSILATGHLVANTWARHINSTDAGQTCSVNMNPMNQSPAE